MNKYEVLSLFGIMNMHPDIFFVGIQKEISDLSWDEKDDILIYLNSLNIPFEVLFDLFDQQYDYLYYNNLEYSIDYFVIEEAKEDCTCKIGIFEKSTASIFWLDEYEKEWKLGEKDE